MFSFTPDGNSLFGESLDVRGFWVAEAVWVTHAGGAGKVIAEWMVEGIPSLDLREADLNRFHGHVASPAYVRARGAQQYREVYDIIHPLQQMDYPRGLRRSPFQRRLEEQGAVFFESAGWERPQWFAANEALAAGREPPRTHAAGPRNTGRPSRAWSTWRRASAWRCSTSRPSPRSRSPDPARWPTWSASPATRWTSRSGKVMYTAMLNARGGIQCDLTVTRLGDARFLVVTGGSVGMHDLAWLRQQLPDDGTVHLTNATSAFCCLGLWGPRARAVLQSVTRG